MTVRPNGRATLRAVLLATIAVVLLAGCGPNAPTPAPAALLVENRLSEPILVGISGRGTDLRTSVVIEPCGGTVDFVPGLERVPEHDWIIGMLRHASGDRQALRDAANWDASENIEPIAGILIMWTTGEINAPQLPRWLTVEPSGVVESGTPPDAPAPANCLPWAEQPEG